MHKIFFSFFLTVFMALSIFSQSSDKTSIAMLNYLTTEARNIIKAKNNRLSLEELYNKLVNDINLDAIDETTQDYFRSMRASIQKFRAHEIQRERLMFILQNAQAQAITKAIPNPMYIIGAINFSDLAGGAET